MNRDDILHYLEAGGEENSDGITLTEKQLELIDRWRFADEKIRERKYKREQIAQFLIARSAEIGKKISRDTAYRDIVNAEYVFCSSFPLNKKYLIHQRIEFLQMKINDCYINNDYLNAALLEKVLQKYIDSYPETQPMRSPKTIIFNVQNNNNTLMVTNMTEQEAMNGIDQFIDKMEKQDDW